MEVSEDAMLLLQRYRWPGNIRELQNVIEQAMWFADREMIDVGHLPPTVRTAGETLLPQRERRRQIADDLYDALVSGGYSFWDHIHPIFLSRDITRHDIRELVVRGLRTTHGNYRALLRLFGIPTRRLQALPQLPDGARLQGGLPLVPPGHAGTGSSSAASPSATALHATVGRVCAGQAAIKSAEDVATFSLHARSSRSPRRLRAGVALRATGQT